MPAPRLAIRDRQSFDTAANFFVLWCGGATTATADWESVQDSHSRNGCERLERVRPSCERARCPLQPQRPESEVPAPAAGVQRERVLRVTEAAAGPERVRPSCA